MPQQTTLITALILEGQMCLDCLAAEVGMNTEAMEQIIKTIEGAAVVHQDGRCRSCGVADMVFKADQE